MANFLNPWSGRQFVDSNGKPYSGAKLFVYAAGSSTKVTTYKDSAGTSNHTNPILLNTKGEPADSGGSSQPIWQAGGSAVKLVLASSTDTDPPTSPISTWDNISGINDTSVTIDQWVTGPTPTYSSGTSFTLVGDQTSDAEIGRRIKTTNSGGTVYSTITNSVFTSVTTVTVVNDSGALDSGLSALSYGLITSNNSALPAVKVNNGSWTFSKEIVFESTVNGFQYYSGVVPGTLIFNVSNVTPAGYLKANGATGITASSYPALFAALVRSNTVTMTLTSPGVVTWTTHLLEAYDPIKFTTTGTLPTGLVAGTVYYVSPTSLTADSFRVRATPGGADINFTVSQSGVHTGINAPFGVSNDLLTFDLPDMRGEFPRGLDSGRGVDSTRSLGSAQSSANLAHGHDLYINNGGNGFGTGYPTGGSVGVSTVAGAALSSGGSEARPRNIACPWYIKY
jgi:hypothetical protein